MIMWKKETIESAFSKCSQLERHFRPIWITDYFYFYFYRNNHYRQFPPHCYTRSALSRHWQKLEKYIRGNITSLKNEHLCGGFSRLFISRFVMSTSKWYNNKFIYSSKVKSMDELFIQSWKRDSLFLVRQIKKFRSNTNRHLNRRRKWSAITKPTSQNTKTF